VQNLSPREQGAGGIREQRMLCKGLEGRAGVEAELSLEPSLLTSQQGSPHIRKRRGRFEIRDRCLN
jgi:hypothetical protein